MTDRPDGINLEGLMGGSVTPTTLAVRPFVLPRRTRPARLLLAGSCGVAAAGLLVLEMLLGGAADGQTLRGFALIGVVIASIGLASGWRPAKRTATRLCVAERTALNRAFHGAPGSAVPIEGRVRVER